MQFTKYLFWLALILAVVGYAKNGTMSGGGTTTNPWQVEDYADLKTVGLGKYTLNDHYRMVNDIDASASAGENTGFGFIPIGYASNTATTYSPFSGGFHGGGHVIKNLFIFREGLDYVGLFAKNAGIIDSLGLVTDHRKVTWVTGNEWSSIRGRNLVGSFAGLNSGSITACYNHMAISASAWTGGGIAGANSGTIQMSYSTGAVFTNFAAAGIYGATDVGSPKMIQCWSSSRIRVYSGYIGGLLAYVVANSTPTNTNSFWNKNPSPFMAGYSVNYLTTTQPGATTEGALTEPQLRTSASFTDWDFSNQWQMDEGKSFPAIRGITNAPFAMLDSLEIPGGAFELKNLLANDVSVGNANAKLTLKVLWYNNPTYVITDSIHEFRFAPISDVGTTIALQYVIGEVRSNDTLWGNVAEVRLKRSALEGLGTDASPYLIHDLIDLKQIGKTVTSLSKVYEMVEDIDATPTQTAVYFHPIGYNVGAFTGKFHGKGHKITNYTYWQNVQYVGLFSTVSASGEIDSLTLVHPQVAGHAWTGSLVGQNNGKIHAVKVDNAVIGSFAYGAVGGLVGGGSGSISHAIVSGSIDAQGGDMAYIGGISGQALSGAVIRDSRSSVNILGNAAVGGIAGRLGDPNVTTMSRIYNCVNTGKVKANGNTAGGLIGEFHYSAIDSSMNTGNVRAGAESAGGLVGFQTTGSRIRLSVNTGSVQANWYAGGLVGAWYGSNSALQRDSLLYNYNTGRVRALSGRAGGLVGHGNWGGNTTPRYHNMTGNYSTGRIEGALSGGYIGLSWNNGGNYISSVSNYWDVQNSLQPSATYPVVDVNNYLFPSNTGMVTSELHKAENYEGWDFSTMWKFSADSLTTPGFQYRDNAPFAFGDTIETDSLFIDLLQFLENDFDIESGRANLILKLDSLYASGATATTDSLTWVRIPDNMNNRDSVVMVYRVGEIRTAEGDTLWGNLAYSKVTYINPFRNAYYALYAGNSLSANSTPLASSLNAQKATPVVSPLANPALDLSTGVAWAEPGEENISARGFQYIDDASYATGKTFGHIVATIKATEYYPTNVINTLITEGFNPGANGKYAWIRLSYLNSKLRLELWSYNVTANSVSSVPNLDASTEVSCPPSALFSGRFVPVHIQLSKTENNVVQVDAFIGNSLSDAASYKLSVPFPTTIFHTNSVYTQRIVELPRPGTASRLRTQLDEVLANASGSHKGAGSILVGDFGMMSSMTMNRKDLVKSYLAGWKQVGAGTADTSHYIVTTEAPLITQILYAAPGDQSTTSYTKTASKSTTTTFSYGSDMSLDFFAGIEIEPDVFTGMCGASVEVGAHMAMAANGSNSYTTTIDSYEGVSTTPTSGDVVSSQVIKVRHHLIERPRLKYLGILNDTVSSHKVYYIAAIPEKSTQAMQTQSVREFVNKYKDNQVVMQNFASLYGKDLQTGNARSDLISSGALVAGNEFILEGGILKVMGEKTASETAVSQSFEQEFGMYINAKIVSGGASVGFNSSFNVSRGEEKNNSNTTEFQTDVSLLDDESWDQIDVIPYKDLRWGVPLYDVQEDNSYTSGPVESGTMPVTTVDMELNEGIEQVYAGDTVEVSILITNNSSPYNINTKVDEMQFLIEPNPNFAGVYQLLEIQPAQFELARGESMTVNIRYKAKVETTIPVGFYVNDGFIESENFVWVENSDLQGVRTVRPASEKPGNQDPVVLLPTTEKPISYIRSSSQYQVYDVQGRLKDLQNSARILDWIRKDIPNLYILK